MKYSTLATSLGSALCLSLCPLQHRNKKRAAQEQETAEQEQETAEQPVLVYVLNTEMLTSDDRMWLIRKELDDYPLPHEDDEMKAAIQRCASVTQDVLANIAGKLNAAQIRRIKQRAASGHTVEQTLLAFMHLSGEGVEQDVEKSINLFATAARSGDKVALTVLGCMYAMSDFGGKDYFRLGTLMLEQAAVERSFPAMYHLSFINLMTGDIDKANYWYQKVVSEPDKHVGSFGSIICLVGAIFLSGQVVNLLFYLCGEYPTALVLSGESVACCAIQLVLCCLIFRFFVVSWGERKAEKNNRD